MSAIIRTTFSSRRTMGLSSIVRCYRAAVLGTTMSALVVPTIASNSCCSAFGTLNSSRVATKSLAIASHSFSVMYSLLCASFIVRPVYCCGLPVTRLLSSNEAQSPRLRIRVLGSFIVERDGHEIPPDAWERRRAVDVLQLLVIAPRHRITRDRLIEELWPDKEAQSGANNLYRAI